jgi:NitT/TauT family transport system permease protein
VSADGFESLAAKNAERGAMSADRQARNATDFVEALTARTLRANRRGRLIEHAAIAVGRSLLIVAILVIWGYAAGRWIDAQSTSDPLSVLVALWELIATGRLWPQLGQTVTEVLAGYAAGAVAATLLAFAFASAPAAERVLRPFLLSVYSIPKIALAPLMVMWFGLGIAPKIILAGTFVFFIVFMNAVAGIQSVNRHHINIIRVMGASRQAVLLKVVIPTMVPFLLLGLRISIPEAMTGAVIGEFISASQGLGYLVYSASNDLNMAVSMAAIIVLVVVVAIGDVALGIIEQRLPWQPPGSKTIRSGKRPG